MCIISCNYLILDVTKKIQTGEAGSLNIWFENVSQVWNNGYFGFEFNYLIYFVSLILYLVLLNFIKLEWCKKFKAEKLK